MKNTEHKEIIINGRKVLYFERGNPAHSTMVLLHGYPGSYEHLMDFADALGSNFHIIIPNFPSCGGSEPMNQAHTLEHFTAWLGVFLQEVQARNFVLVGHSFGSRVALSYAVRWPKEIKRLVLITPVLKADSVFVYVVLLKYKIAKLLPASAKKAFLASKLYEYMACKIVLQSRNPRLRKEIIGRGFGELVNVYPDVHIELFEEFYQSDLTVLAKKLAVPTLVMAGSKDQVATVASVKLFTRAAKNISLKIITGAGHLVPFERPRAVANLIKAWLNR